ncbi:MAG: flagellar protein export ATPase FliI [Halieaceae bacterium]
MSSRLQLYTDQVTDPELVVEGRVCQLIGLTMVAEGCQAPVGSRCRILPADGGEFEAEVVGFAQSKLYLMPIGELRGLCPNARVIPADTSTQVKVGQQLLGRVIDATGAPLDDLGEIRCDDAISLQGQAINPFHREPIREPLDVGVRAVNSLFTVGRGQRMGLFAGSGVGKSTLLGLMTRYTEADVVVVGLIGERGREVREFVEEILGSRDRDKAVVIASPADDPPLMRIHGAWLATAVAEHFRNQGLKVLLLMDSLTRFAQAQREIALAIGEPPVTKGYPPSVFVQIPRLVERSGNGDAASGGSITAIYTVLVEGDDQQDPIADAARAILDGHIVLSRQLAEAGVYPAIDIEASISRIMPGITSDEHQGAARHFRQLYSTYQQSRDLISVGAYQHGSDPAIDLAIAAQPQLMNFLQQGIQEQANFSGSLEQLAACTTQWSD